MKAVSIMMSILVIAGVITFFNTFNLFGSSDSEPINAQWNETGTRGIILVDDSSGTATTNWWEANIPGASYIAWMIKAIAFIWNAFMMVFELPVLIETWVPGDVGIAFGLLINGLLWFIVAWSGFQIYMKISTKYMD